MAAARAGASPGGTRSRSGSIATSAMLPTREATKGTPEASDSRSTLGMPSDQLERTVRSAARYQSGSS
jgi:hypothetical protein